MLCEFFRTAPLRDTCISNGSCPLPLPSLPRLARHPVCTSTRCFFVAQSDAGRRRRIVLRGKARDDDDKPAPPPGPPPPPPASAAHLPPLPPGALPAAPSESSDSDEGDESDAAPVLRPTRAIPPPPMAQSSSSSDDDEGEDGEEGLMLAPTRRIAPPGEPHLSGADLRPSAPSPASSVRPPGPPKVV